MYKVKDIIELYCNGHYNMKFIPELDTLFKVLMRCDKCNLDEFKNFYKNSIIACNYVYSNNEYLPYVIDVVNSIKNDYMRVAELVDYSNPYRRCSSTIDDYCSKLNTLLHNYDNYDEPDSLYLITCLNNVNDFINYNCITVMKMYLENTTNGVCRIYYDVNNHCFDGTYRENKEEIIFLQQLDSTYNVSYKISDYDTNTTIESFIKDMYKYRHNSEELTKHLIDGKFIKCESIDELNNKIDILNEEFGGSIIVCKDCGKLYFISSDENTWYTNRDLVLPCRCKLCRNRRRAINSG